MSATFPSSSFIRAEYAEKRRSLPGFANCSAIPFVEHTEHAASATFAEFIRAHRAEILALWKSAARSLPRARGLPEPQLLDAFPELLDAIARLAEELAHGHDSRTAQRQAFGHAWSRVVVGFDLPEVVAEFRLLRECILMLWEREHAPRMPVTNSCRPINIAIDHAVGDSITQYVALRSRVLRAIDHVSSVAMGAAGLDQFLSRLLTVFMDEMPSVQTCVILLREGDQLRARAAIGLEEELAGRGFCLAIGEGFAGTIASTGKPLLLHAAESDPIVVNPVIHNKGVKALYGVPLLHETQGVIGVAHMGSLTANDFAVDDMDLFLSMAARAALGIQYHLAKDAAEQATRVRDDILGIVSHDLRNALGIVLSASELLRRALLLPIRNDRAQRALSTIRRSANRMTRLVEDLLDYGSIESGRLRLRFASENAAEIISDVVDAHAGLAAEREVRLDQVVDEDLPRIECDRERIFQLFGNLIGNAMRFSPSGTRIEVGARAFDGGVELWVSDEGPGIDEPTLAHLFERYWRGPDCSDGGRGLGLFIVKGIAEAHGGTVGVTSARGRGSRFYVRVPAGSVRSPDRGASTNRGSSRRS
jgi:signal transduction histidine kinase